MDTKRKSTADNGEIIENLDRFFGEIPYSLEWVQSRNGRKGVIITYTDFLSEHLAGKMLSDIVPSSVRFVLKRVYSDAAVSKILLNGYKKNRVAVVDCYGGDLQPKTIRDYVNGRLAAVEML